MAFAESSSDGTTNGTTAVEMVAAPGSSTQRIVKSLTVYNADTVDATVFVTFDNGTNERRLFQVTLSSGDQLYYDDVVVLPDTSSSINIDLSGAVTTNELEWTAHYADAS